MDRAQHDGLRQPIQAGGLTQQPKTTDEMCREMTLREQEKSQKGCEQQQTACVSVHWCVMVVHGGVSSRLEKDDGFGSGRCASYDPVFWYVVMCS